MASDYPNEADLEMSIAYIFTVETLPIVFLSPYTSDECLTWCNWQEMVSKFLPEKELKACYNFKCDLSQSNE